MNPFSEPASGSGRMMSALNRSYLYATRYKGAE